jgi:hypothetical protein
MKSKKSVRQRPLFADWPQALSTEVQQEVERLLANMYLEVVNPSHEVHVQEPSDELPTD